MVLMDDIYYIEILNSSRHAIISMDIGLNITFINKLASELLDATQDELLATYNPLSLNPSFIDDQREQLMQKERIPLQTIVLPNGSKKNINGYITGLFDHDDRLQGISVFIRPSRNIGKEQPRRTFGHIRILILKALYDKRKTINQIAKDINVNWKTVENHLTYLSGKQFIAEVFTSEYVRIFSITPKGKEHLKGLADDHDEVEA